MIIDCEFCSNRYAIPDEVVSRGPQRFRCVGCAKSWTIGAAPILTVAFASSRGDPHPPVQRNKGSQERPAGRVAKELLSRAAPALASVMALASATVAIRSRAEIVSAAPGTAAVYAELGMPVNLRGLSITDVHATIGSAPGENRMLLVTGEIANLRARETAAPDLTLTLRARDGQQLYVWTVQAPKGRLAPGEHAAFGARLATPPNGVYDLLVKFSGAGDKGSFTESPS